MATHLHLYEDDMAWHEEQHPRARGGKFAAKGTHYQGPEWLEKNTKEQHRLNYKRPEQGGFLSHFSDPELAHLEKLFEVHSPYKRKLTDHLQHLAKAPVASIKHALKHELHKVKGASRAVNALVHRRDVNSADKKALEEITVHLLITAGSALSAHFGEMSAGATAAAAVLSHHAFIESVVEHTAKHMIAVGRYATYRRAHDSEDGDIEALRPYLQALAEVMQKMDLKTLAEGAK